MVLPGGEGGLMPNEPCGEVRDKENSKATGDMREGGRGFKAAHPPRRGELACGVPLGRGSPMLACGQRVRSQESGRDEHVCVCV